MSWTNKGYSCSVIFSLLANSRARSNGILHQISMMNDNAERLDSPDAFEVHRTDLNDMTRLFTLQDTVSSASCHSCNVQKLGSVDHVVICGSQCCIRFECQTVCAYPRVEQRIRLSPRPGNIDYPRLPIVLRSREASSQGGQLDQCGQTSGSGSLGNLVVTTLVHPMTWL